MTRELLIPIARDVVEHAKAGTIKQAKEIMRLPATHYTDSSRFNTEVERLIKRVPIVLGPSCEIPNPGDFKTLSIAGMSLIVSRANDGKAMLLLMHAPIEVHAPKKKVEIKEIYLPLSRLGFSNVGDLLAVSAEKDFGSINKNDYGLISLPVYESAGLIWAILNPKSELIF